jgi:hypothetical protein
MERSAAEHSREKLTEMREEEKKMAVTALNECYEIVKRLVDRDRASWGSLYAWIGREVKQQPPPPGDRPSIELGTGRSPLHLILACLKEIEKEAKLGHKPDEFWSYMGGIRRRVLKDEEAKKARKGEPTRAGAVLAETYRRMIEKSLTTKGTKGTKE